MILSAIEVLGTAFTSLNHFSLYVFISLAYPPDYFYSNTDLISIYWTSSNANRVHGITMFVIICDFQCLLSSRNPLTIGWQSPVRSALLLHHNRWESCPPICGWQPLGQVHHDHVQREQRGTQVTHLFKSPYQIMFFWFNVTYLTCHIIILLEVF